MDYLAGIVVAGLLFLSLHYFTELSRSQKTNISLSFLAVILLAVAYNSYSDYQREKMLQAVLHYKQGKTINCNGQEVNSSTYSLSIGTYTFIGKKGTPHYAEMISAESCQ